MGAPGVSRCMGGGSPECMQASQQARPPSSCEAHRPRTKLRPPKAPLGRAKALDATPRQEQATQSEASPETYDRGSYRPARPTKKVTCRVRQPAAWILARRGVHRPSSALAGRS